MIHLKLNDLINTDEYRLDCMPFKMLKFNGGEINIQIDSQWECNDQILIETSLTNSEKIMELFIATDALRRAGFKAINLFAPYLPYARQDRVCNPGEALSIKVICSFINLQRYRNVYTLDNHSEVSTALLNNHVEIDSSVIIKNFVDLSGKVALVSPDAGALKKTYKLAKILGGLPVIECSKRRDVRTGAILSTEVYDPGYDLDEMTKLLIVDDICDGGRTFTELAKALRNRGANKIDLYVSHGIFSQGLEVFKGLIDNIYTTKSFKNEITDHIGIGFRNVS